MLEPKVIKAFATSIEPVQPLVPCSLTRLYTIGLSAASAHLDIAKKYNGLYQKMEGVLFHSITSDHPISKLRVK